jgi:hypothetical protein
VLLAASKASGIYVAAALFITLFSLRNILFWIPLNVKFFEKSKSETNGKDSFAYAAIGSVLSILLLPLAALCIQEFGYSATFLFAALLGIPIAIIIWRNLQEKTYRLDFGESFKELKGLKSIIFFEGAIDQLSCVVIPIITLLYIKTELGFGGVLSYLALVSLVAAYFMATHSDKKQKRVTYLVPLFFAMAGITFAMGFTNSFGVWIVLLTLFSTAYTISYPMRLALIMDRKKTDIGFWTVREVVLNAGRFVTLLIAAVLLYFSLYWAIFAMYAAIFVAYPFVAKRKLAQ